MAAVQSSLYRERCRCRHRFLLPASRIQGSDASRSGFCHADAGRFAFGVERAESIGGGRSADARRHEPDAGRMNLFAVEVADLETTVESLRKAGARFRNDIVKGVGGKQNLVEDPSGNPVELFEPIAAEARFDSQHSR